MIVPPGASGSTVGVSNLEQVPVSSTGIMSQPTPYDTRVSGNRDGSTAFYASENGFLTEVSVGHWNTADVTVRIYIFQRGAGDSMTVAHNVMTMLLPMAPVSAPIVTTQPVPGSVAIVPGDRIGMTLISGGSSLHALVDNLSPYPAPGTYPSPLPATEPSTGSSYDFISGSVSGPLIRGTVSATPGGPGGGGGTARTTPLAGPISLPRVRGPRTIRTSVRCQGLGIRTRCLGTVEVTIGVDGTASATASAGSGTLGSTSYDIADGETQTLSIKLNKAGRKRLAKKGKLTAYLRFTEQIDGQTVTSATKFTAKKKK